MVGSHKRSAFVTGNVTKMFNLKFEKCSQDVLLKTFAYYYSKLYNIVYDLKSHVHFFLSNSNGQNHDTVCFNYGYVLTK